MESAVVEGACWSTVTTIAPQPASCAASTGSRFCWSSSRGYNWNQRGPPSALAISGNVMLATWLTIIGVSDASVQPA